MEKNNRKNGSWRKEREFHQKRRKKEEEKEEASPSEGCEKLTSIKQEGDTNSYKSKRTWKFKILV